jgi:hypothetical protein
VGARQAPARVQDQRHQWAYLSGAARPGGEAAFALVLPTVDTGTMHLRRGNDPVGPVEKAIGR